jgi:hypothetical protein
MKSNITAAAPIEEAKLARRTNELTMAATSTGIAAGLRRAKHGSR